MIGTRTEVCAVSAITLGVGTFGKPNEPVARDVLLPANDGGAPVGVEGFLFENLVAVTALNSCTTGAPLRTSIRIGSPS